MKAFFTRLCNLERWSLRRVALRSPSADARRAATKAPGLSWPDKATRKLLLRHSLMDGDYSVRLEALVLLVRLWPDDTTRDEAGRIATEDDSWVVRAVAVRRLAET